MPSGTRVASFALLGGLASAARLQRNEEPTAAAGFCDELITFGAPRVASEPLRNPRASDGCFGGRRYWTLKSGVTFDGHTTEVVDGVPSLPPLLSFHHPMVAVAGIDVRLEQAYEKSCSERTAGEPAQKKRRRWSFGLHGHDMYTKSTEKNEFFKLGELNPAIAYISTTIAHEPLAVVEEHMREIGWRFVGSAFTKGKFFGGPQWSHLVQQPDTLDCVLTFQGTKSINDWLTNALIVKESFCGLKAKVHLGWRNNLLDMVRSDQWQSNIRPALSSCRKVIATGHSMGGSKATLFAACAASAPKEGEDGFEHYNALSWTRGTPTRMKYMDE